MGSTCLARAPAKCNGLGHGLTFEGKPSEPLSQREAALMLKGRTATPGHGGLPVLAARKPHSCAARAGACPGKQRQPLALQPGPALVQPSGVQRRQAHCTLSGRQWAGSTLCECVSSSSPTVWAVHPCAAPAPRRTARLRAVLSVAVVVLVLGALAAAAPGSVSASVGSEGGQFSLGAACQGALRPEFAAHPAEPAVLRLVRLP